MTRPARGQLDLWSGIGLAAANMIGAGVFLSAGFMAQDMTPGWLLLAWVVGMGLAMSGARAYAEVARLVPHSGGEYRYLSDLIHPSLGYLAGWASLLIGFSAPIAINAIGAAAFLGTVMPLPDSRLVAEILIAVLTLTHSIGLVSSKWTQNALIALKVALLVAFVVVGLVVGSTTWPTWQPPSGNTGFSPGAFFGSLFYVAFAFSGWNAAIYAADEFRDPARDVPRAMLWGCAAVGVLYLAVNFVFVANLTPSDATVVFHYQDSHVTLAHALTTKLLGPTAARFMSVFIALAFISAISAMVMIGPRIYATMAADGFLPRMLQAREGRPPVGATLFQSAVAAAIVWANSIKDALDSIGALLVFFAALTAGSLFWVRWRRPDLPRPRAASLLAAGIYVTLAIWILVFGVQHKVSVTLLLWSGAVVVAAFTAYGFTERVRRRNPEQVAAAPVGSDPAASE